MNKKHGLTGSKTYEAWSGMKRRCLRDNFSQYKDYGGRGLSFHKAWSDFEIFLKDMGEVPEGRSLDRIDNNLGYYPGNCRWASIKEQNRNRRTNRIITHKGRSLPLCAWAEIKNIPQGIVWKRIRRGWSVADSLNKPVSKPGGEVTVVFENKYFTLRELAEYAGVSYSAMRSRYHRGWRNLIDQTRTRKPR